MHGAKFFDLFGRAHGKHHALDVLRQGFFRGAGIVGGDVAVAWGRSKSSDGVGRPRGGTAYVGLGGRFAGNSVGTSAGWYRSYVGLGGRSGS